MMCCPLLSSGRSYQFDEFLVTWGDKLRSGGKVTPITAGLQKDIDKYQVHTYSNMSPSSCPSPPPPGYAASTEVCEG